MAITSAYTRPQVGLRLHSQREIELGRYENQNLLSLAWCEAFFHLNRDNELVAYAEIRDYLREHNIYTGIPH